ncbi:MAG: hypothetical protein K0R39_3236 [Symbiobacteriaceae bacterium]|jgi:hypothetical protein|nr:hypothetical protein [Symbiobacteriaceae bacterium]
MLWGLVAGVGIAGAVALFDAFAVGYYFGLQALIIGVGAGGLMLLLAFAMSLGSYWLATRGRLTEFRRKLLAAAIFTGAAGMACGFGSFAVWLAAGSPIFP